MSNGNGVDEAMEALASLLDVDPVTEAGRLKAALGQARVRDEDGLPPVDPDWVPTWNVLLAAAVYAEARAVSSVTGNEGGLESFSSEGSAFKRRPGSSRSEWLALAQAFRRRGLAGGPMHVIEIEAEPAFTPRSRAASWRA